ncbi:endoplasmic oxidoreductin-1, partial [Coemansia biformis]
RAAADGAPPPAPARKRQWLWTAVRIGVLAAAAAATVYVARDPPRALGLSARVPDAARAPSPNVGFMAQVLQKSRGQNICKPEGFVSDTYSDFDGIEALNHRVAGLLDRLVRTKFFRTLKVDLYKPCRFWRTEGSCFQRDCIVQPLDESEVPAAWCAQTTDQNDFGPFL